MTLKKTVNDALIKATGYHFTKHQQPAAARPKRIPAKPTATYPRDFDDAAVQIIDTVKARTMTAPDKLYALYTSINYIVDHAIAGAVVECGVWRGGSMQAAALALIEAGDTSRDLYLFDTFEGMSEPTAADVRADGTSAAELMGNKERRAGGRGVWAYATLDDVKEGMAETGYPAERIHYVQGKVEDTLPDGAPATIAILRLDTDWYESTKHELDVLYPRLVSGGVLLLDDYGFWEGSRKAVHEFLDATRERLLLIRMASGRIAVKP